MFELLLFIVCFVIIYVLLSLLYEETLKKDSVKKISIIRVLTDYFKLDKKKVNNRELLKGVTLINSFIISLTVVAVDMIGITNILWFFVAIILIILLILLCYFIYGMILKKKWGIQDEK